MSLEHDQASSTSSRSRSSTDLAAEWWRTRYTSSSLPLRLIDALKRRQPDFRHTNPHCFYRGERLWRWVRRAIPAMLAGGSLALALALPPGVRAAGITVNGLGDGDLVTLAANTTCDLREAIEAANTNAAVGQCAAGEAGALDTITLPAGIISLSAAGAGDDLNASGDLDIIPGGGDLAIIGQGAADTIIRGNFAVADRERLLDIFNTATVTISGVTLTGGFNLSCGGAICNDGTLTITDSVLTTNVSEQIGGAIYNSYDGVLTIVNSTISSNSAPAGGAIYNNGQVTITDSTISGNDAAYVGGGIFIGYGAVTLSSSTISGNSGLFSGGGIYNAAGDLTLANSTVSSNTTRYDGGGIFMLGGSVTLVNSTISANTADSDQNGDGDSGGLRANGTTTLRNSIIAGNHAPDGQSPDLSGLIITATNNLIGDSSGSLGITNGTNGNIVNPAPGLGPLANNGGPTRTHALLFGSPAIDAGDNATCDATPINQLDQRGDLRPQGPSCDIGAFEAGAAEINLLDGTTDIPDGTGIVSFGTTPAGSPLQRTFTISNTGVFTLSLSAPTSLPTGFSLVSPFPTSVAPGGTVTFTLQLDATTAGTYSGEVSFATTDIDENPFNFTVNGIVGDRRIFLPLIVKP